MQCSMQSNMKEVQIWQCGSCKEIARRGICRSIFLT